METDKARRDRTKQHNTHIWVKREVLTASVRPVDFGAGHANPNGYPSPVYAYVCRCGETGMPVR